MLSLRDTGKIQQDNASVLQLGAICGLTKPFSLKEFILRDCIVQSDVFRIGVVLIKWSLKGLNQPRAGNFPHSNSWYENFFLNWRYENGVANFWYKQSFGKLKIEGNVLGDVDYRTDAKDIVFGPDNKGMLYLPRANNVLRNIFDASAESQGGFPENFDAFIGVFSLPAGYRVDGGSSGNFSAFDIADSFAFHTHEVGHLIGGKYNFNHSFGLETADYRTGMYGHPYCVMSAEAYGGKNVRFDDNVRYPEPEENFRGPGLSGATRSELKWANVVEFNLGLNEEAFFTINSLGSNYTGIQVLRILDGEKIFFVEYRSAKDSNDMGVANLIDDAAVVISVVSGGIATKLAPLSATFLDHLPLKFASGEIPKTIINFNPFWGLRIIDFNASKSTVLVQIVRNRAFSLRTYRRTHHIKLASNEVDSWDIIEITKPEDNAKFLLACEEYDSLRSWRMDGNPIRNLRSLI